MNKRSRNLLNCILALALLLSLAPSASAHWSKERRSKDEQEGHKRDIDIIRELNLTPEQQLQINQQRDREKELYQQTRKQIGDVHREITDELDKDNTDMSKIEKLVLQIKELYGKSIQNRVEGILALKKILTPEQFRILNEKTKKHKRGGSYEKKSHNFYYYRSSGSGCIRPKFCQRLG